MTQDEKARRMALAKLAIACGYAIPSDPEARDAWHAVYLKGLAPFHLNTVLAVCGRLETTAKDGWFPPLPVLCEAMRSYVRIKQEQTKPSLQIQGKPVSPEQIAALRDRVAVEVQRRKMRS